MRKCFCRFLSRSGAWGPQIRMVESAWGHGVRPTRRRGRVHGCSRGLGRAGRSVPQRLGQEKRATHAAPQLSFAVYTRSERWQAFTIGFSS